MLIHEFRYKKDELYCEQVRLRDIAEKVGTPAYVYSYKTLVDHLEGLKNALKSLKPVICYSMKANSNLAILRALVRKGAGLDIVSGGEQYRAEKVGCPSARIVFAGVGKNKAEIKRALAAKILLFNVESVPELDVIQEVAVSLKRRQPVALRVNPDVGAGGHEYTTTGSSKNKFGIDFETTRGIFKTPERWPALELSGVHVHIGSQILTGAPFVEALNRTVQFVESLQKDGITIRFLDIGGGLGIIYDQEKPQTPKAYAEQIVPLLSHLNCQIILEPGRFIVGNAGVLLTEVQYVKTTPQKNFIIVDAAMNDLMRPALYGAFHDICPLRRQGRQPMMRADVVGPICETGDFLAKDRYVQTPERGAHWAILSAGAYGFSMSSNYNSRPRAAEVLVRGARFEVIRERESLADLVRGEKIPAFLK